MNKRQRVKRPELKRSEPIRAWSATVRAVGAGPARARSAPPATQRPTSHRPAPEPPPAAHRPVNGGGHGHPPAPPDAAAWGARLGYQVIDEYLRRGQDAARDVWSPLTNGGAMRDPRQMAGRLLQYATDLSSGWIELVTALMMNGGAPPGPTGQAPGRFDIDQGREADAAAPPAPAANGVATGTRLALQIRSAREVDVAVDLETSDGDGGLLVHDLRASSGRKPRLTGVRLDRPETGGSLTLRLQVPDRHPPGTYRGAIVNAHTSLPCGSLTVTIPG